MSLFEGASNVFIYNGKFIAEHSVHGASGQVMEFLAKHVVDSALPDGRRQSELAICHPNTRTRVLEVVERWAGSSNQTPILWLNGGAGAGKSTILRTLVEQWHKTGDVTVAACFFCAQAAPCGEERGAFVPTLAYQLAQTVSSTRKAITHAIVRDPALLRKSIGHQFLHLIIMPLAAITSNSSRPVIIVIDGLDECYLGQIPDRDKEEREERAILKAIAFARQWLQNNGMALAVKILIASRPEQEIRSCFESVLQHITVEVTLDKRFNPSHDIEIYLRDQLQEVSARHQAEPHWPSNDLIQALVRKSSGHFIYPSLVLQFIKNCRTISPKSNLEVLCGPWTPAVTQIGATPLSLLDELYLGILNSTLPTCRESISNVLGALCYRWGKLNGAYGRIFKGHLSAQSPEFLERLLFMRECEVRTSLIDLHSILDIPRNDEYSRNQPVRIKHATFSEFLANEARSKSFWIDKARAHLYRQSILLKHVVIIVSDRERAPVVYDEPAVIRLFMRGFMQMFTKAGQQSCLFTPSKSLKEGLEALLKKEVADFFQHPDGIGVQPKQNRIFLFSDLIEPEEELAVLRYLKGCNIPKIVPSSVQRGFNSAYLEAQILLLAPAFPV